MGAPVPGSVMLLYPADRTAFQYTGPGRPILVPPITPFVIYADEGCLELARIYDPVGGGQIERSTLYSDDSGLLPEFFVPDQTRVWAVAQVQGQSVPPYPLDAAFGPRIDALAASIPVPGDTGTTANTIRSGDGPPSGALGADGDWYIDKTAYNIYGPKTTGLWGPPTSLVGPAGPAGPAGTGSGSGGAAAFTYSQYVSSALWDITHPLGFVPNVTVVDSSGSEVFGDLLVLSSSRVQIKFSAPFSGSAFLS